MKIINDIIMSIKNFLSYLFKDNDPTSTDLFDANWGNGVTAQLNSLLRAPHITIPSDDRQAQLNIEGGIYYIGTDGLSLGYPANYLALINMKRDANLNLQLLYSNVGIWARTVNHNNSSLEWKRMDGLSGTSKVFGGTLPAQVGYDHKVMIDVSSVGDFPYILTFRYRNNNYVWQDARVVANPMQSTGNIVIQLTNATAAGLRYEIVVTRTF